MTLILYVFSFVMGGMPLGRPFPSFGVMGCLWGAPFVCYSFALLAALVASFSFLFFPSGPPHIVALRAPHLLFFFFFSPSSPLPLCFLLIKN